MNFEEHAAKPLLRAAGIDTPRGMLAHDAGEAAQAAKQLGRCVVKAQVATGKRGKAGGIRLAADPEAAREAANAILGMRIGEHRVERLLVEEQVAFAREMYAAVLDDPASKGPLLLFSAEGGMDIEEIAAKHPDALVRLPADIRTGLDAKLLDGALPASLPCNRATLAGLLDRLFRVYVESDAELLEINPLVVAKDGRLVALDCKLVIDDSALPRHQELAKSGMPEPLTDARGAGEGPRPQVHRARRQRRRARQRRGAHHDHHGCGAPLRRQRPPTSWRSAERATPRPSRRSSWCWPTRA